MERPSRSTFPGGFVFPGGVAETTDESEEWLKFYESFGIDDRKLQTINSYEFNRPAVFQQFDTAIVKKYANIYNSDLRCLNQFKL